MLRYAFQYVRERLYFDWIMLRNSLVVFTVHLGCDAHMRTALPYGFVAQSPQRCQQFRAVHARGRLMR